VEKTEEMMNEKQLITQLDEGSGRGDWERLHLGVKEYGRRERGVVLLDEQTER